MEISKTIEDPITDAEESTTVESKENEDQTEASWDIEKDIFVELSKEKQKTINFKDLATSNAEQFLLYLQAVLPIQIGIKTINSPQQKSLVEDKMFISIASSTFKRLIFYVRPCKSKSGKQVQAYETDDGKKFIEHVYKNILEDDELTLPQGELEIAKYIKFLIAQPKESLILLWSKFFEGPLAEKCEPLSKTLNSSNFAEQILKTRAEWFPNVWNVDGSMKPEYVKEYKSKLHKNISSSISAETVIASNEPVLKAKKTKQTKPKEPAKEKKKTSKTNSTESITNDDEEQTPKKPAKKGRKPKNKEPSSEGKSEEENQKTPKKQKKSNATKNGNDIEITIKVPRDDNVQSLSQGDVLTAVECVSKIVGIKPTRLVPLLCALEQLNSTLDEKS